MSVGERIKQIRKENGLTLMKFGGRLGVSAQAISLIEKGTNAPSDQTIRFICREFHINEEWLRTGEGEPHQADYQDDLWNIVQSRGLDRADYALIAGIMQMPDDVRKALIAGIVDLAERIKRGEPLIAIPTMAVVEPVEREPENDDMDYIRRAAAEVDIEAEVEAYRKQLEAQKKAAAKTYLSDGFSGTAGGSA